jgi:regulator of RNase E activity RraA
VHICPGDVVVGDQDGVVIVGRDDFDAVHEQLEAVRAAESSYPMGAGSGRPVSAGRRIGRMSGIRI